MAMTEGGPDRARGMGELLTPIAILTVLALAGGGFLGWSIAPSESPAPQAQTADKTAGADAAKQQDGKDGHASGSESKAAQIDPSAGLVLKELSPILTNLAGPGTNWVRLQASILYDPKGLAHPDTLFAELISDTVAYLRTVSMDALEGAEGLRQLNEELEERADVRSEGRIKRFFIQALVVQ